MSNTIHFQYNRSSGDTWAFGTIGTDQKKFEFDCSCLLNNPLEELLTAIYQILPKLARFPRKEMHFTMYLEPNEYRWEFKIIDEQNISIHIYEIGYDIKTELIFEDHYNLVNLLKAITKCIRSNPELISTEKIDRIYKEIKLYLKNIEMY